MTAPGMNNAIVFFFDDNYYDYFRACINSLKCNFAVHPKLLAGYDGCRKTVIEFLDSHDIERIRPETPEFGARVRTGPVDNGIVLRRFALWTDAFSVYDKVLHLDVDTLVLGSLQPLFEQEEFFVVANHEPSPEARVFQPGSNDDPRLRMLLREDGIDFPGHSDDMVNAGVFMIPRRYRNGEERGRLEYLAARYGAYLAYADQSLLSLYCKFRGIRCSTRFEYNYQSPFFTDETMGYALRDLKVVHFSNHKPGSSGFMEWERLKGWRTRLTDLYLHYREMGHPSAVPA